MELKKTLIALTAIAVVMNSSLSFGADVMAKTETPAATVATASASAPDENTGTSSNDNQAILTEAVTLVRTRIDIPEEYEDFSGSVSKSNGVNTASLVWKTKNGSKSVCVTVTGKLITRYDNMAYEWDNTPSFGAFTKDEYVKKALAFVEQANPTMKDKLEIIVIIHIN